MTIREKICHFWNKPSTADYIYVFAWFVISLFTSYPNIIKGDFSFIDTKDNYTFMQNMIRPLMVWLTLFFIDFYQTIQNTPASILSSSKLKHAYHVIASAFFILFCSMVDCNGYGGYIWALGLAICNLLLKYYAVRLAKSEIKLIDVGY